MLGVTYLVLLLPGAHDDGIGVRLIALLISALSIAGFAHVVNDIFDIDSDQRTGKPNAMAGWPKRYQGLLCFGLGLLGFIPWPAVDLSLVSMGCLSGLYILPLLYSIPPIRLKERGAWGLLSDALLAHTLPTLFILSVFLDYTVLSRLEIYFAAAVTVWSLATGLRNIILHQFWDRQHDIEAEQDTALARSTATYFYRLIIYIIMPLEILSLIFAAAMLYAFSPAIILSGLAYGLIFELARYASIWTVPRHPAPLKPGSHIFLHDYYEIWLPLSGLFTLCYRDAFYLPVLGFHLILFHQPIRSEIRNLFGKILPGLLKPKQWSRYPATDFYAGDWWLRTETGAEAMLSFDADRPDRLSVQVKRRAGAWHGVQLNRLVSAVEAGKIYRLSFSAKSTKTHICGIGVARCEPDWGNLGVFHPVHLEEYWQQFQITFIVNEDSRQGRIHFDLGDQAGSIDMIKFSLECVRGINDSSSEEDGLGISCQRKYPDEEIAKVESRP